MRCSRENAVIHRAHRYYIRTHVYVLLFSVKNARLNYCEFNLEDDLVGVPHT